jgi:hypothetical protein
LAPQKGQTIGEYALQKQLPALRYGRSSFSDGNGRRRCIDCFGRRDRERLFDLCSDHNVRNCCLIRFNRDSELSSRAEAVDARLGGLLLVLSFDQRCLRHEEKWHVFPRSFFSADLLCNTVAVKVPPLIHSRLPTKKGT